MSIFVARGRNHLIELTKDKVEMSKKTGNGDNYVLIHKNLC